MHAVLGQHDVLFLTLDTLRFDVAAAALAAGELTTLGRHVERWEPRDTPGTFTYAAHCAFFAGFLPTPRTPGPHVRELAVAFPGSETIDPSTAVFDAPDLVTGFADAGYRTICIGGTGFFNPATPLGAELPGRFQEAHWERRFGVTEPASTVHQVDRALERLAAHDDRVFLFLNVSAMHQPNCHHVPGQTVDDVHSQRAALVAADRALAPLFETMAARAPTEVFAMSDHGTLYGEDGHTGHRVAHPIVTTVPWARFRLGVRRPGPTPAPPYRDEAR